MSPGDSILDLACGFGRHSLALSKQGYRVLGVDLNPGFVAEASRKAQAMGSGARFLCADMRDFHETASFDHIILMYNSFGYFQDPKDDEKVIENSFDSLRPGGNLLLQATTRELIMAGRPSRQSRYWFEEEDGGIRLEEATANEDWTWNATRWILLKGAERREYSYGMRIYGTEELCDLLSTKGFASIVPYGDLGGRTYDSVKNHLTLAAKKPEKCAMRTDGSMGSVNRGAGP
jgi:SAM-dependent methyltransferase